VSEESKYTATPCLLDVDSPSYNRQS